MASTSGRRPSVGGVNQLLSCSCLAGLTSSLQRSFGRSELGSRPNPVGCARRSPRIHEAFVQMATLCVPESKQAICGRGTTRGPLGGPRATSVPGGSQRAASIRITILSKQCSMVTDRKHTAILCYLRCEGICLGITPQPRADSSTHLAAASHPSQWAAQLTPTAAVEPAEAPGRKRTCWASESYQAPLYCRRLQFSAQTSSNPGAPMRGSSGSHT